MLRQFLASKTLSQLFELINIITANKGLFKVWSKSSNNIKVLLKFDVPTKKTIWWLHYRNQGNLKCGGRKSVVFIASVVSHGHSFKSLKCLRFYHYLMHHTQFFVVVDFKPYSRILICVYFNFYSSSITDNR